MAGSSSDNSRTGGVGSMLSSDRASSYEEKDSVSIARNGIWFTTKGDVGAISSEPSNKLCVEISYGDGGGVKPTIIGAIFLYDDMWAIFSTLNVHPEDGRLCEIGIADISKCKYIPVVRSSCLKLSPSYPVKGVVSADSVTGHELTIYWVDGYNPDRILRLGDMREWDFDSGYDPMTMLWLNSLDYVPYVYKLVTVDPCPDNDVPCVVKEACRDDNGNLIVDCSRLNMSLHVGPIEVSCVRGTVAGTLPDGIYHVAVAYMIGGSVYGNYYVSPPAHVFTDKVGAGSLQVYINVPDFSSASFDNIQLVVISNVGGNISSRVIGSYDIRTRNVLITSIDQTLPTIDPSVIFLNNPISLSSENIEKVGPYLVKSGIREKFDFNYQPLANLIEVKVGVFEFPEDYYDKSGIYGVTTDAMNFMRDEVYTFFIRWIYDTGDRSPSYHIPAPPPMNAYGDFCDDDVPYLCDDGTEQVNYLASPVQAVTSSSPNKYGGTLIATVTPGTFLSDEVYDCRHPERWNFSWFRENIINKYKNSDIARCRIRFPYPYFQDARYYDLCCKRIRLVRMPDETLNPVFYLYNMNNRKFRMLGVRFGNIIHPVDNNGNFIEGIVGFEILRASRDGHKTIVAKGIVERTLKYNYINEKDSNNVTNAVFANYPFDPEFGVAGRTYHPYLALDKTLMSGSVSNNLNVEINGDSVHNGIYGHRYYPAYRNDMVVFRSPEVTFGNIYTNWHYFKEYKYVIGDPQVNYVIHNDLARNKLLSPRMYSIIFLEALGQTMSALNGSVRIRFSPGEIGNSAEIKGGDTLTGMDVIATIFSISKIVGSAVAFMSLGSSSTMSAMYGSGPTAYYLFNTFGIYDNEIFTFFDDSMSRFFLLMALANAGKYTPPQIENLGDGILSKLPKSAKKIAFIPLFISNFSRISGDLETLYMSSVPYQTCVMTIAQHSFYAAEQYLNKDCTHIKKIKDAFYVHSGVYDYNGTHINHIGRTKTAYVVLEDGYAYDKQQHIPQAFKDGYVSEMYDTSLNTIMTYGNPYSAGGLGCCSGMSVSSGVSSYNPALPKVSDSTSVVSCKRKNTASAKYVSVKINNRSPYGDLMFVRQVLMGSPKVLCEDVPEECNDGVCRYNRCSKFVSDWYIEGDTYVSRYTEKDVFLYFREYPYQMPDGFPFDYMKYRNLLFPRFWINGERGAISNELYNLSETCECSYNVSSLLDLDPCKPMAVIENIRCFIVNSLGIVSESDMQSIEQSILAINNSLSGLCNIINSIQSLLNFGPVFNVLNNAISGIANAVGNLNFCNTSSGSGLIDILKAILCSLIMLAVLPIILTLLLTTLVLQVLPLVVTLPITILTPLTSALYLIPTIISSVLKSINKMGLPGIARKIYANYNLDGCFDNICEHNGIKYITLLALSNLWMPLAHGSVRDFYVESDYNMNYRKKNETGVPFFDSFKNNDLAVHFSAKNLKYGDDFIYDRTMMGHRSFPSLASMSFLQPETYDPYKEELRSRVNRFKIRYSLPKGSIVNSDGWRVYLTNNFKVFEDEVTGVKSIGDSGAVILFKNTSPLFFQGVDTLETASGIKITVGDAGLFQQPLRSSSNSDPYYQYGSCQDSRSIVNTPAGIFYISGYNRDVLSYGIGSLESIVNLKIKNWFYNFLRFKILDDFPDFPVTNNTLLGIGFLTVYNHSTNSIHFIKRDYILKDSVRDDIKNGLLSVSFYRKFDYLGNTLHNVFVFTYTSNQIPIIVPMVDRDRMLMFFKDVSFNISYSLPLRSFISFHDWHPAIAYGNNNTFFTVLDNSIWVHGVRTDSFCNFYGLSFPFEIDINSTTGGAVSILRSLEVIAEAYKYSDNSYDRFHVLDYFFDELVVYNSEQCSGVLRLNRKPKNNPLSAVSFPQFGPSYVDILYEKVENRYRINQFADLIRDRGEFSNAENIFIVTEPNGYVRYVDAAAIDYGKSPTERKKFRHYSNNFWFRKRVDDQYNGFPYQMVFILSSFKSHHSFR